MGAGQVRRHNHRIAPNPTAAVAATATSWDTTARTVPAWA
jgi:hypothetical protein